MRTLKTKIKLVLSLSLIAIAGLIISCMTLKQTAISPPVIPGATFVGAETCAACHEKEDKHVKLTAHGRIEIPGIDERIEGHGCEACHGPGSLHVEAGGGRGKFIINPGKNPETCFQCHLDKNSLFSLQFHHPVKEGKMSCNDCHDPHGENIHFAKSIFVGRVNETCAQCHLEQSRPRVFEHEALREGCTTCHNVHGSINDKMLIETGNNLCLKCHGQIDATPGTVRIGDSSHNSRIPRGGCFSAGCHTAIHGSDVNPHLRY